MERNEGKCPNCKTAYYIGRTPIANSQDVYCKHCGLFLYKELARGVSRKHERSEPEEKVTDFLGDALKEAMASVIEKAQNVLVGN